MAKTRQSNEMEYAEFHLKFWLWVRLLWEKVCVHVSPRKELDQTNEYLTDWEG
jgi:hypothetical protein